MQNTTRAPAGARLGFQRTRAQPIINGNSFADDLLNLGFYDPAVGVTVDGSDGADQFDGGPGDDTFNGLGGDDDLSGDGGADILIGGSGLNTMTGGADADIFVIDPSALTEVGMVDVITDYDKAEGDTVDLGDLLDAAFGAGVITDDAAAEAAVHLRDNGGNTNIVIDINGADPDPGGEIVVAELTGAYTAINILYDGANDADIS